MGVIKVNPLIVLISLTTTSDSTRDVINVTPDVTSIVNTPPAIDIETDPVSVIIATPEDLIGYLVTQTGVIKDYSEFLLKIKEVLVRFNTDPKLYKKEDYLKLILAVVSCFKYLYSQDITSWSVSEWQSDPSNSVVPTEKLVKESLDAINSKLCWIRISDIEESEISEISEYDSE